VTVRVAVPRRPDGGERDRLWSHCRAWWRDTFTGWELVEGLHRFGPFNRSAAVNRAADGDWDTLVVADADTLAQPHLVAAAVEHAGRTGRMTLPYRRRMMLTAGATDMVLAGSDPATVRAHPDPYEAHASSVVVVPRGLWDKVGGFDPRFVGWGAEDDAFAAACAHAGGGIDRFDGDVWHLAHSPSPEFNRRSATYLANVALLERYRDPYQIDAVLADDRGSDQVVAVVLTTGDRPTLAETITSIDQQVTGPIGRRIICVDGTTLPRFDGWETVQLGAGLGYTAATAAARRVALQSGQPWVFWSEDDFTFDRAVDLTAMQAEMDAHPDLAQLSLMRQAWYADELAAGGIVAANPNAFTRRGNHLTHRAYWAQNPHLCRRITLTRPWPTVGGSERAFWCQLFASDPDVNCGVWGDGTPWVTHTGTDHAGHGY